MRIKVLLIVFLLMNYMVSWGQTEKPYIEVIGSAESEINPNIIVLSIRLKEYDENKVKINLSKIEDSFLDALAKSKIMKENIALSDLTLNGFSPRRGDREVYSQKTYQITFSRTDDVLALLGNLKNVKIEYLSIVKLSHTEIEKYRLELKIEALKQAQKKADALLNSLGGVKRGKVLIISEQTNSNSWFPQNAESNTAFNLSENTSTIASDIPLQKIKLRYEILARFEIE